MLLPLMEVIQARAVLDISAARVSGYGTPGQRTIELTSRLVLDTIVNRHPDYDLTALLRRVPEGFERQYPNVKVVKGDYDSVDVLSEAAREADVVVREFLHAWHDRAQV